MSLYFHLTHDIFSDEVTDAHQQTNFRTWNKRSDPAAAYAAHGWQPVTETAPNYDQSPLTGDKVRSYDGDGTWSWTVDGKPWSLCVDVLAAAKQKCRAAIDAAITAGRSATVPYTLPAGAKLDGVDAAGSVVQMPLVHPIEGDLYWPKIGVSMDRKASKGQMGATERFGAVEGRIDIPAASVEGLLDLMTPTLTAALTKKLDLEDAFSKAATAAEFAAITALVTGS